MNRLHLLTPLLMGVSLICAEAAPVSMVIKMPVGGGPNGEQSLEIAMKNISKEKARYGIICGWPMWATNFVFALRDAERRPVDTTPAGEKLLNGRQVVTCAIGEYLEPGQTLRQRIILSEVFSLERPGEYTVRVAFHGTRSNKIRFQVSLGKDTRR
jgi:hypothetical protein